ncbi:hypothetical protein YC2023_050801 [Brassica napus]
MLTVACAVTHGHTCHDAWHRIMQRDTPMSTCLAAWLESMRRDTPIPTCRSTCFGYMCGDTSCFYMSSCMCNFHTRRHLEVLLTLSLLDGRQNVLDSCIETPRATRSIRLILVLPAYFRPAINPEYFSSPFLMR